MSIDKPVALITGASRGIGRAIAISLANQGYNLALLARSERALVSVAEQCESIGVDVLPLIVDVRDKTLLTDSVDALMQHFSRLDTVICNHGISDDRSLCIHQDKEDLWENIMLTNLNASMHLARLVLPHIMNSPMSLSRALIFIASISGKTSMARHAAYCASKHGLIGFANAVFEEVREYAIKVSSICPGWVNTELANNFSDLMPEKMITVEDVAETVNYILAMAASCCPAEIILKPQVSPYKK